MPELDGPGLCRALRENPSTAHIPVIILTGHMDPGTYNQCIESGIQDVLTKPVEPVTGFERH